MNKVLALERGEAGARANDLACGCCMHSTSSRMPPSNLLRVFVVLYYDVG